MGRDAAPNHYNDAVFAYQSWKDDTLWCFINNGRAVEGGTHEDGVREAMAELETQIKEKHLQTLRYCHELLIQALDQEESRDA